MQTSDKTPDWSLNANETLLWQGRPAPRCYTFRHWGQALLGSILFLACSFWLMVGVHLVTEQGYSRWLLVVPILLVAGSFLVGPGRILLARWRWETTFYALSDQRLLIRQGRTRRSFPLERFRGYRRKEHAPQLWSLRLSFSGSRPVFLECLEHPRLLIEKLPDPDAQATAE